MLLGVDVGGTFTDAVLIAADGTVHTAKAPSTPRAQQLGVMRAAEAVLRQAGVSAHEVVRFAHGMTVATNALLEGSGARTALVASEGFVDVVELGRQARPSLYRLCEAAPAPLAPADLRFGAPERMGPDGPLRPLRREACEPLLERLEAAGPQAIAVVLLHSYAHPEHERLLGEWISERMPGVHLSLSHELVGTFREFERAATTEIDASLSPLLGDYLRELSSLAEERGLPPVQVMQSSGGLTDTARAAAHAALTILSGPTGGVSGALLASTAAGERDVLCFDMGGTSCDVCLIESGAVAETAGRTVTGRPLALPALDIHTVGAGGGSIAWRDTGGALRVGPQSAGADPGPACYGHGGEDPTVTDANMVLGRLPPDVVLAGGVRLDLQAAEEAVGSLAERLGLDLLQCAQGIVTVAETEMRRALAVMTVERGTDPRGFALMAFGGAGPLHAAALADSLGMTRVLCPRACGVLCALGLASSAPRSDATATVMLTSRDFTAGRVAAELARLTDQARSSLRGEVQQLNARYELRYRGQSFELGVEEQLGDASEGDPTRLREAFEQAHEQRYGYRDPEAEVELVNVRVTALGRAPEVTLQDTRAGGPPPNETSTRIAFEGEWVEASLWQGDPRAGTSIDGPALCALGESTLLVPPGWSGHVDPHGTIVLDRSHPA